MDWKSYLACQKAARVDFEICGYKLRNFVLAAVDSVCDLTAKTDREKFLETLARFTVALSEACSRFNKLPKETRFRLDRIRVGVPPRKLFDLLSDASRAADVIKFDDLSLDSWQSVMIASGLPCRYGDWVAIHDRVEEIDFAPSLREKFLDRAAAVADGGKVVGNVPIPDLVMETILESAARSEELNKRLAGDADGSFERCLIEMVQETGLSVDELADMAAPDFERLQAAAIRRHEGLLDLDGDRIPPGDGLYRVEKCFVWGGQRFERLTKKMIAVMGVFESQYRDGFPLVPLNLIKKESGYNFDGSFIDQAFKQNRKGEPPTHPVASLIKMESPGNYRLLDPHLIEKQKYPKSSRFVSGKVP